MWLKTILEGIGGFVVLYSGFVKLWVIQHQVDFAALIKLAETQFADGVWTSEEKEAWANEAIGRLILCGLPWYIPKWAVKKAIKSFIHKVLNRASEMKCEVGYRSPLSITGVRG